MTRLIGEYAPYNGIIASAAPTEIPFQLIQQLAVGGVMVIPVGHNGQQVLQRVTRKASGYEVEEIEPVTFVPFLAGKE